MCRGSRKHPGKLRLEHMLAYLCTRGEKELACIGLEKYQDYVRVKWTKRRVTIVDMEHICCKLYIFIARTQPNRACNLPKPTQPHCWPVKGKIPWLPSMKQVAKEAYHSYTCLLAEKQWLQLSAVFSLGNDLQWKKKRKVSEHCGET